MDDTRMQKDVTDSLLALAAVKRDTQHDVATILGLAQSSVASKFAGRVRWTLADLAKLSKHYEVSIDELTAGPWAWLKAARQAAGESGANHRYSAPGSGQVNDGYPDLGSPDLADALVAA